MRHAITLFVVAMLIVMGSDQASALEHVSSQEHVVDCSGCSSSEKKDAALQAPITDVLYADNTMLTADVDVTDYLNETIVRYSVTIVRTFGGFLNRSGTQVGVPTSTQQQFAEAVSFVESLPLAEIDEEPPVDPVPVDFPSAFDLVGDQGSQEWNLSNAINAANSPGMRGSDIGEQMEALYQMVLDYLGQEAKMLVQAQDGTLIYVEPEIIIGNNETSVEWHVVEDGLRLADGTVVEEDTGYPGHSFSGEGETALYQLYNGMIGIGYGVTIVSQQDDGDDCEFEFECDEDDQCTLIAKNCDVSQ